MKINVTRLTYCMEKQEREYPLPIGVDREEDKIMIYGRLLSSDGRSWKYHGFESDFPATVSSPLVEIEGRGHITTLRSAEFLQIERYPKRPTFQVLDTRRRFLLVVELGGEFYNNITKERYRHVKELVQRVGGDRGMPPDIKQGNLRGYRFYGFPENWKKRKWFRILNHEFKAKNCLVTEADYNGEYVAVIAGVDIYITSPHHLDSPVHIKSGAYVFMHPDPKKKKEVD